MTAIAFEQTGQTVFYDQAGVNEAEATRLQLMAAYADYVSLEAIHDVTDKPNAICIDIGAGDSTTLGSKIIERNPAAQYRPIDIREEAVRAQSEAGFDSKLGYATDLPFEDNTADSLHARFTLAWLDEASRTRAFEEMLRVGKNEALITIIDYDWSVAEGPAPVNKLVGQLTKIMGSFGFDPYYGARAADEMKANLEVFGYTEENTTFEVHHTVIQDSMVRSLNTIEMTVRPVIGKLTEIGLKDVAEELTASLEDIRQYTTQHPDEFLRLPDMVAVSAKIGGERLHVDALSRIHAIRSMGAESLRKETMVGVGPAVLGTFRLPSSMIMQARHLHASAYREHGHVTEEAIVKDGPRKGALIEEIDPQSLVEASTYLGAVNDEGTVTGCIRLIEPKEGDITALPTVGKIRDALGADSIILKSLPFMQPGKRSKEASALGSSSQEKDRKRLSKLLLATLCEAKKTGNDYVVMGIVPGTARLLTAAYGEKAFKRIDGEAAVVTVEGKGIKPGGIKLVPFYVDLNTFISDVQEHFRRNPNSEFVKENAPLFELTGSFMRNAA